MNEPRDIAAYQARVLQAEQVMHNDRMIIAHLVGVIAKHVKREHWPRIVHEFVGLGLGRHLGCSTRPTKETVEAILAEAQDAVDAGSGRSAKSRAG